MAYVPDGFDYSNVPSIDVWDTDDFEPDVLGVLLDHKGRLLRVIEQPRRRIGF